MHVFLPSTWTLPWRCREDEYQDNVSIFDEEGEIMAGMNMDPSRRAALERRHHNPAELESRLSRDLEEGFMDDSDDEVEPQGHGGTRR